MGNDDTEFTPGQRNTLSFVKNRIYQHKVLCINYTTYDLQRAQDLLNPWMHADVMVLSHEDIENPHPYWYTWICWNWQVARSSALLIDASTFIRRTITQHATRHTYSTTLNTVRFLIVLLVSLVCLVCPRIPFCTVPTQCLKYNTRRVQHPSLVLCLILVLLTSI